MAKKATKIELTLSIGYSEYGKFIHRNKDPKFFSLRDQVFERDNYTCRYCDFHSEQHMYVANINRKYGAGQYDGSNLATACPLCIQCHFLYHINNGFGGGWLIGVPEKKPSQALLDAFCHACFCSIHAHTGYMRFAQTKLRTFRERKTMVDKHLFEGACDPHILSRAIMLGGLEEEFDNMKFKPSLKVLPVRKPYFKSILDDWTKEAIKEIEKDEKSKEVGAKKN